MQQLTATVLKAADGQRQIGVTGFQYAVAIVQQPANLKDGFAAVAQRAQLAGLVIQAGRLDCQRGVTFDDTATVVQIVEQIQVDTIASDLADIVVQPGAAHAEQILRVEPAAAVIQRRRGNAHIRGLRRDPPAIVAQSGQCREFESLRLNGAALAIVVQIDAVAQDANRACFQCAFDARQHTATVVDVGSVETDGAGFGDDSAALVIEVADDIKCQTVLALDRAFGVGQAVGLEQQTGGLAIDQAIPMIEHRPTGTDSQIALGGNGALVAVV
ncbi:hypothetical protein D3C81_1422920 [compost metagenome]